MALKSQEPTGVFHRKDFSSGLKRRERGGSGFFGNSKTKAKKLIPGEPGGRGQP